VAIVGGGGKSSLMFALAATLPGRVVMTTTTRIFASQRSQAEEDCTLADPDWRQRLEHFPSSLLIVGEVDGDRAKGVPAELPAELLAHPRVDWVVVEADGSRMRPVKAPAEHEPVVPPGTGLLVAVVGIDALAAPIRDVAHRPERVSALTGLHEDEALTPAALATLLTSPQGGLKHAPPGGRVAVLINKVETPAERAAGHEVARHVLRCQAVERVVLGALRGPAGSRWEIAARG
jgi:molybdenum cofactor cytidylyltransferase